MSDEFRIKVTKSYDDKIWQDIIHMLNISLEQ